MLIKPLTDTNLSSITHAFNTAFSDYIIKLQLTEESLMQKMRAENIKLDKSFGAFVDNELIGFILNGLGTTGNTKVVYNGGTGVIPEFRGKKVTEKLYQYILPVLKDQGYAHHRLEVIENNDRALRVYKKVGFEISRSLNSFRGTIDVSGIADIEIRELTHLDWRLVESFWNVQPSWQNSSVAINNTKELHNVIGAFKENKLVGYIIHTRERLKQFGVKEDQRGRGIGRALFSHVNKQVKKQELNFINFEESDKRSISFFTHIGFKKYIGVYEMDLIY